MSIESDRRQILRDARSARCSEDRHTMIGLAVIRGLALVALAALALIAVL